MVRQDALSCILELFLILILFYFTDIALHCNKNESKGGNVFCLQTHKATICIVTVMSPHHYIH